LATIFAEHAMLSELKTTLRSWPQPSGYCIAFSGGLDSSVLLHAMAALRGDFAQRLRAVHINHGLNADAGRWQEHCREVCAGLGVGYVACDADVSADRAQSLEARARKARYARLRELLLADELLLTAHHRDDQLETVLLQLLRGAGPAGLAAMPALTDFGRGRLGRPLLTLSRAQLQAYAQAEGISWIDDSSNADPRFDRNYLRAQVIPALTARWSAAARTVSRSARHCAEAAELLAEIAAADLTESRGARPDCLSLESLGRMQRARQANLVRYWLADLGFPRPPAKQLTQILTEVVTAAPAAAPRVAWPGAEVRRYRGYLYAMPPLAAPPQVSAAEAMRPETAVKLTQGLGELRLEAALGEGFSQVACGGRALQIRFRAGGERCRLADEIHRKPLKKLFQERGIVPWMRARLPLIFADDALAAVVGFGVCSEFAAQPGEPGWRIVWTGHPPLR
jgi:tRNA(Ile)-lysidine synthase